MQQHMHQANVNRLADKQGHINLTCVSCGAWTVDTAEVRGAITGLLARLDLAPSAAGPGNPAAAPEGSAPGPGSGGAALPELAGALGHAAECIAERLRASEAADKSGGAAMNGVSIHLQTRPCVTHMANTQRKRTAQPIQAHGVGCSGSEVSKNDCKDTCNVTPADNSKSFRVDHQRKSCLQGYFCAKVCAYTGSASCAKTAILHSGWCRAGCQGGRL